jgi:hypothetical protein
MDDSSSLEVARSEARRGIYLVAMGIDSYVSSQQLPGAAPSRRISLIPARSDVHEPPVASTPAPASLVSAVAAVKVKAQSAAAGEASPRHGPDRSTREVASPDRFSLAAIVAGDFLWLEELDGIPLAREQVQLVAAMARAAAGSPSEACQSPEVAQFNWPIHNNAQLDQSREAAQAALAGFIQRKIEQHRCRAVVFLGEACATRVPDDNLLALPRCQLPATLDMLRDPRLKKRAWIGLQGLIESP